MSLRARFLIALVALLTAGLALADVATYLALRNYLDNQTVQQLQQATSSVISSNHDQQHGGHGDEGDGDSNDPSGSFDVHDLQPGVFVEVRDASGAIVYQSTTSATASPSLPSALPSTSTATQLSMPATDPSGPEFAAMLTTMSDGDVVVVAVPLNGVTDTLSGLLHIEALVSVTVLALAGAIAMWLARVGLRPLDEIGDTAAHIAAGDLTRRIDREDDRTEIGRLGQALNDMMGQIEGAFTQRTLSEERLRRFAADASHELRTPLAAVQAYAELFDRGAQHHPDDLARLLQNIREESARMAALLDDLLLLTRLDQGRPLEARPVDLGVITNDAVDAARVVDPTRSITLTVAGSVEVTGDRRRLRQVIDNLLANARLHTPPETPIDVAVDADGRQARLRVTDHGAGITEADTDRIFERFYRADPARSRSDGGSGLGLSIVAAITNAHGGQVTVASTPGQGATFIIELPLLLDVDPVEPGRTPIDRPPITVST